MGTFYTNQFKKSPVVGSLDLNRTPEGSVMSVRYNPDATSTLTMLPGEGVLLTDLGSSDSNAAGVPLCDKRTNDYDRVFGIKTFNIKKNASSPNEVFDVAKAGAVMFLECSGAINRDTEVSLVIGSEGIIQEVTTGYTPIGKTIDKGADGDIVRVLLSEANADVAAT